MSKKFKNIKYWFIVAGALASYSTEVLAESFEYLANFPAMCSEASDRQPLPGHILRLGFVAETPFGWSLLFPEQRNSNMLERVLLLDNAGVIGQHPDQDLGAQIRFRTPAGHFIVAQVFVGDTSSEPVVTCVTSPIPLAQYRPTYYGPNWNWLDSDNFGRWLSFRRYGKWRYNSYWNFDRIRGSFRSYWHREGSNKYKKFKRYRRFRDDDRRKFRRIDDDRPFRKRDDRWKGWKKNDGDKGSISRPIAGKDPTKDRRWRAKPTRGTFKVRDTFKKPDSGVRDIVKTRFKSDGGRWHGKPTRGTSKVRDSFKKPDTGARDIVKTGFKSERERGRWSSTKPDSASGDQGSKKTSGSSRWAKKAAGS